MNVYLIVVAGGVGARMQSSVPKQFMQIDGKPIIVHTIKRFTSAVDLLKVVVVINASYKELWEEIPKKYNLDIHKVVNGGEERFFSVRNALLSIDDYSDDDIVLIHDAVRPLVSSDVILNVIQTANNKGCAIPVYKVSDSVREISGDKSKIVDRSNLYLIQTPQGFNLSKLKKAYNKEYSSYFTDDASVYENAGFQLYFVEGNRENIKITYPQDFVMAKCILKDVEAL